MDTSFDARAHGGFTLIASIALIGTAALSTVESAFQARRAARSGHVFLASVNLIMFVSGISYAVVMVSQACFFVDALLDALSLLFISNLDQQAFRLVKELRVRHHLTTPWRELVASCVPWRHDGRGSGSGLGSGSGSGSGSGKKRVQVLL